MTNDTPSQELDADARALLGAYQLEHRIPDAVHDRVWDRLETNARARTPARWFRRGAVLGMLMAATLAALWIGGRALRSGTPSPLPSQAEYERVDAPAEGQARRSSAEVEEHETGPPATDRTTTPTPIEENAPRAAMQPVQPVQPDITETTSRPETSPRARPRKEPRQVRSPQPSEFEPEPKIEPIPMTGGTLAEENRLLGLARSALIDDQPLGALAQLAEHARRFPAGVLLQEREALRAIALCEAGRGERGVVAARSFLRAHPQATLAQRVRRTCLD